MGKSLIILAGGKSSRMGTNKALLRINKQTVIEIIYNKLQPLFSETIIVTNNPKEYTFLSLPIVEDIFKGLGPLAGIHAGLTASKNEHNLIVACDMPFVNAKLANILLTNVNDYDVVVPILFGKVHPLYAVYTKKLVPLIATELRDKKLKLQEFLALVNTKYLAEDYLQEFIEQDELERSLFNMNNERDYLRAINNFSKKDQESKN